MWLPASAHHKTKQHHGSWAQPRPTGPSVSRSVVHLAARHSLCVHPYGCLCPAQPYHCSWHCVFIYMMILYPRHGCRTPQKPNIIPAPGASQLLDASGRRWATGPQAKAGWVPLPKHSWWPKTAPSLAKSLGAFCLLSPPRANPAWAAFGDPPPSAGRLG